MNIKRLNWDCDFFGLRIGRVDITSAEEGMVLANQKASVKEKFDLLYVFVRHGIDMSLPNARLVDEKVVYAHNEVSCGKVNPNVIIWDANNGVTDDLLHLALVSGEYSRFKLDGNFPSGSYERLYSRWIEQSVNHRMASEVFCYMVDKAPKGLVTLDNRNDVATIGLVSIHEDFRHQGIGTAMMRHVVNYAQEEKRCERLSVATQLQNVPACRLYEKSGFVIESITDVWHWWL